MTQAISSGFCHYCHNTEPLASLDELRATQESLWQRPVLQLLDIQNFVSGNEPPRFYLALSDGRHCVWGIVPPGSALESEIHSSEVECGCLLTIADYVVVAAKCGKCVMIILDASSSSTHFSLIGEPVVNAKWMPLSSKSLIQQRSDVMAVATANAGGRASTRNHRQFTARLLHEFMPENGVVMLDPMDRWSISGRVLWKSKLRKADKMSGASMGAGLRTAADDDDGGLRYVFDCVLVDQRGDAMKLVFWGCKKYFDAVEHGKCIRVSDGTVKRSSNNEPLYLSFQERSLVEPLGDDEDADDDGGESGSMPEKPKRLIGSCAEPFLSVSDVLHSRGIGDVVTVQGIVVAVQPCVQIRTVRGNVDKMTVVLRDAQPYRSGGGQHAGPQSSIELTLWDETARTCRASPGQLWCLRDVTVRFFGSVKQLSTRASSEMFELPLAFLETGDPAAVFAVSGSARKSGPATSGKQTTSAVQSSNMDACMEGSPFFFGFCHSDVSETSFVLCRISHIKLPLFYVACKSCGVQMKGVACLSCSSSATELRFLLRMDISDGVERMAGVVGFTSVAETLFGETTASFLSKVAANPSFGSASIADLIGLPVLMKIAKSGTGIRHILDLKHVDLSKAANAIACAIAAYGE